MAKVKFINLTSYQFGNTSADYFLSEDALIFPNDKLLEDKILVPKFWVDNEKINLFKNEVEEIYQKILPSLCDFLNDVHQENESVIYWERLIGFWLESLVNNFLEKIERLKIAFEKESELFTISLALSNYQTPMSTMEYMYAIRGSLFFHLQQFSEIFHQFYPSNFQEKEIKWSIQQDAETITRGSKKKVSLKGKIKRWIINLMDKGYQSDIALFVTLFSNKELQDFFYNSKFKVAPIIEKKSFEISRKIEKEKRSQIDNYSTGHVLGDFILKTGIKHFFPIEYMEGYSVIKKDAIQLIQKKLPKAIFTGIGFMWDAHFSIWAAKCANKGTKLFGIQHGGTYGEVEMLGVEKIERNIVDKYITWGWEEDEKTIPLPAPRLITRQKINHQSKGGILWVTTADSRFNYFVGNIVFGSRFLNYFEHQQILFNSLSPSVQNKIKVRLYPDDFGWQLRDRWLEACPKVQFANSKENFLEQASQASVVIIDHMGGTTILESLSINVPTLIVGDPELFQIRKEAQPYYSLLKEVGVIYSSIDEAAKFLNENIGSIANWWNDIERQKVIRRFKKRFAYTEKDAIKKEWFPFFKSILKFSNQKKTD